MSFINPVGKHWLHFFSFSCFTLYLHPSAFALCLSRAIEMYVVWRMMTEGAGLFFKIFSITHVSLPFREGTAVAYKGGMGKSITLHSSGTTHLSFHLVRALQYMQKIFSWRLQEFLQVI